MATRRVKEEPIEELELQMGPLIDCMMILLMYFIIAGQIKTQEKYLGLLIPGGAGQPDGSIPIELVLAINEAGQVFCNDTPLDTPTDRDLRTVYAKIKEALNTFGEKQPVIIHPQPKVRQQRIVDVLNICAEAGVKNLSFNAN